MSSRRRFLQLAALGTGGLGLYGCSVDEGGPAGKRDAASGPIVLSTWRHGIPANAEAWAILESGGHALDAVEAGVRRVESDPAWDSVGYGGRPDRDGHVTLDACIMNPAGDCGSVAFLQHVKNPISVARRVMEDTPHVMLVGEGALRFALESGFPQEDLLTEASRTAWQKWQVEADYRPVVNVENHDTIGMLALDDTGDLAGACTTSGLAYKRHGRVGDSPIIGAGLYVDNQVGAACATGLGEAVIRVCGSHVVVEMMRQGRSPEEACREALQRILDRHAPSDVAQMQVGFLALNHHGEHAGLAIQPGFNFALTGQGREELIDAGSLL